jgi:hypothetical protein
MPNEFDPLVGQWYAHMEKGQRFYVTACDEDTGTVEVQHFDGDIEEFSLEEWQELDIELSEEPENWAGALDIDSWDDLGTGITDTSEEDWTEAQKDFRTRAQQKLTPEPDVLEDDFGEGYIDEEPLE